MQAEFHDKNARAHIYSSIVVYKIISLVVLIIMTVILSVLFHKDKALYHELAGEKTPLIFFVMAACLILFALSIVFDFYILKRTTSIGAHLNQMAYIDKLHRFGQILSEEYEEGGVRIHAFVPPALVRKED